MQKTTWDDQQNAAGETFNPTFSVVGLTYARSFTDRVAFGLTAAFVNERVEQVSARGVSFDFGFTYVPNYRGLKFGVVVKNFGPHMKFDGPNFGTKVTPPANGFTHDLRSQSVAFELPSSVQFGAAWDPLNKAGEKNNVELAATFQSNNFSQDEIRGGGEYSYNDMFFLRAGYSTSSQSDYMFGPALGAGVKVAWGQTHMGFDYSWQQRDFFSGSNNYFTFKVSF